MRIEDIKEAFASTNRFAQTAGVELAELSPGRAVCTMVIGTEHANPFGTVNAGAIYTLAETAFGAAANSHGIATVAVNLSINYVKPATEGILTATAVELSLGNRMATYSVRVHDESGDMVADVQAAGYRTGKPLGELA